MKKLIILLLLGLTLAGCNKNSNKSTVTTICNPLDLSYRFCLDEPSRREAADPTMVLFKDTYYLFASKSGGYWYSDDLVDWTFVATDQIPVEDYAPTAIAIGDTLYFMASSHEINPIYKSGNPKNGQWSLACEKVAKPMWDPAFYMDDDNKLYIYWGCSNVDPLYGVQLDYNNNFEFIGEPVEVKQPNPQEFGWEVPGDFNTRTETSPWIEGAWVNKINGKYYLQYAGPGTEYKSYADAVYVSDNPLGPFEPQAHNPFAYKPEGFTSGAGHGSTFADKYGNYWHIGTITISQKHMFERRLGLFPTFFDAQGTMHSITKFGDYPMIIPDKKISGFDDIFPGWMLLSYGKNIEVSSAVDTLPTANITDEDIRTYWSSQSGDVGEYVILDLDKPADVYALQINFAEHNTALHGRTENKFHQYKIEYSTDKTNWTLLADKSQNATDNTHVYMQLPNKVSCRYIKLTNIAVPDGYFALSGLRVFGKGTGDAPAPVEEFTAKRNQQDKRSVTLTWKKSSNAVGYNVTFGVTKDKLYNCYTVYNDTTITINTLNVNLPYYFSVEAFNENGVTNSDLVIETE